jgi:hypothetical protein
MTTSALAELEEIVEETSFRVNQEARTHYVRGPGQRLGWGISPNIERATAAREKKPQPAPASSPPVAIPEVHMPEVVPTGVEVSCYTELIGGIQARLGEVGIRQVDFDKLAGWAEGLTGKAFGPSQVKRLGPEKLFDAIRAAGLKLRLEADPVQLEKMQKQIAENCLPRQPRQARMHNHSRPSQKLIDGVLSYLASKKGGLAKLNDAVKEARSNWARHAAKARHAKTTQRFENISLISAVRALPAPDNRDAIDSCAEEEATAA